MNDATGAEIRNSNLFWVQPGADNAWILDTIIAATREYNENYGFDISYDRRPAQLTRYDTQQKYEWHMDIGAGKSSTRKISAVVELTGKANYAGGGLEIFYGEKIDNRLSLDAGDIVLFPSFVVHRASTVLEGTRWSLVYWFFGERPFA